MSSSMFSYKVGVIGGAGHVGLPLSITLADAGLATIIYDTNTKANEQIRSGCMPFMEDGASEMLPRVLENGCLSVSDNPDCISECEFLVMIIGTPVDEHLNPRYNHIQKAIDDISEYFRDGQILILRSTVYPGISGHIQRYFEKNNYHVNVSFCPERVAQGVSIREIKELPQIISAFDPVTLQRVRDLFLNINKELIEIKPVEAELAKLMTNSWRYIQFSIVNQFYLLATEHDIDFESILHACRYKYPRMADVPGPGFAAGPCLVKDTMQLAAFSQNQFVLGHSAMLVNEGLPLHLVKMAEKKCELEKSTAGILGMAFKANSDDKRDSLSYKLKKILQLKCEKVMCSDPYVQDAELVPLEQVLADADIIFLGAPHALYKDIKIPDDKVLIDVWGFFNKIT